MPFSEYRTWPGIVLRTSTILTILLINSICGEPKKPWGVFLATSTICNVLSSTFPHSKLNKGEPPPPCRMLNPSPEISIVHNYLVGLYTKQNYEHCAALVILSQNKYATFPQLLLKVLFRLIFLQQEHVFMFAFELYLLEKGHAVSLIFLVETIGAPWRCINDEKPTWRQNSIHHPDYFIKGWQYLIWW